MENSNSAENEPEASRFDIGEKLTQRLNEHNQEKNRTQHQIDQSTAQLQNIIKTTPKRPRESKTALRDKIKQIERDRTSRSLPLSAEKALLRQIAAAEKLIRQHDDCEAHQDLIRRKRADIDSAREALRATNAGIAEIEKVLVTVQLAKRLGCTTAELISREVACPVDKIARVIMRGGEIFSSSEKNGVQIVVDKMHGKFIIKGSEKAVLKAVREVEDLTSIVDLEVNVSSDKIAYLMTRSAAVLEKIKLDNPSVEFDVLARLNRIVLHGPPDKVHNAKVDLSNLNVISKSRELDNREAVLVVGKTGKTISGFSLTHNVIMEIFKSGDSSTLRVIGAPMDVDAALAEVVTMLFENEQIEESINVDPLLRGELITNAGAGIKEFQNSVSNAVPTENGVLLFLDRNASKENPLLTIKCSRSVMDRAKGLVQKKIHALQSNIITFRVPVEIIPAVIGKGGSKIMNLRQIGVGSVIEADKSGLVKIYTHDADTRIAVKSAIEQIVAENQVGHLAIESKGSIGFLFGDPGKEVMAQVSDFGCSISINDDDTQLMIKGTEEQISKSSNVLKDFLVKKFVDELEIHPDDETLLFVGGANSVLHTVETKYDIKASFRKEKSIILLRGKVTDVHAAKNDIKLFIYGGDGVVVIKFKVPADAIGSVVGKGGSNLAKLESDFDGVRIHVPKEKNLVCIRGPEDLAKKCRVRIATDVAILRVGDVIDLTPEQHTAISDSDNIIKKIAGGTNTSIALNESILKIRGVCSDVRDAKAQLQEFFTGIYSAFIDLDESQFSRLNTTISRDSSHFERIKLSTGVDIALDEIESVIKITGKKSNVKKAKLNLMGFFDFLFPGQFQTVKVHKTLYKSMGDPEKLGEIAAASEASIWLDRDLVSVVIRSDSSEGRTTALNLVNAMLTESEKINYVLRFEKSDSWLLPVIIGKGGKSVKKIESETGCVIDLFRDELTVVIRADTEEVVGLGKRVLEAMIDQARRECVFIDIPESAIPAFVGKGGGHIKQLGSDHDVQIERSKNNSCKMKITGNETSVHKAKCAIMTWLNGWEASHTGLTIELEEQFVSSIIGKGGDTIKAIQRVTGCKIDVDRVLSTLTAREGTDAGRAEAIKRVRDIIEAERATAIENAAAKEQLRLEQAKAASSNAPSPQDMPRSSPEEVTVADSNAVKDRSKEFLPCPVGMTPKKSKTDGMTDTFENGTKAGRELYLMLISGNEPNNEVDDQWESSAGSGGAVISTHGGSDGECDLRYRSVSGFTVRI